MEGSSQPIEVDLVAEAGAGGEVNDDDLEDLLARSVGSMSPAQVEGGTAEKVAASRARGNQKTGAEKHVTIAYEEDEESVEDNVPFEDVLEEQQKMEKLRNGAEEGQGGKGVKIVNTRKK